MAYIKDKLSNFLDNGGRDLDYDEYTYPKLEDISDGSFADNTCSSCNGKGVI